MRSLSAPNICWPPGSLNWPPRSMTCSLPKSSTIQVWAVTIFAARQCGRSLQAQASGQRTICYAAAKTINRITIIDWREVAMKSIFGLAMAVSVVAAATQLQAADQTIRIGVLTDMSGVYAAPTGPGSVFAARPAVGEFLALGKGFKIEIIAGDHQNKPDIGASIANRWIDVEKVDVIVDVPTSSVAFVVNDIVKSKNKVFLASGAAASDLTGSRCSPNTVHWTYDTWALANGTGKAIATTGGGSCFFLTANYAFGHALERDTVAVVEANKGK